MTEGVEGRFTGAAGGQVFWQGWLNNRTPRGVVVICHGAAEHSGRYAHVGRRLAAEGYPTYAVDHRGHGRSEGTPGNINRMIEVVSDLDQTIQLAGDRHPELPVFLLGHSMGGLISLDYVTSRTIDLAGLILSGPAVDIAIGSKLERIASRLLSEVVPNLGAVEIEAAAVSRDPAVVRAYETDPLNYHGKVRVRTGSEVLLAADRVKARLSTITLPVLVMHGTEDRLAQPSSSQLVADHASSSDLTLKFWDGLHHEILNEPEQEAVLDEIVGWLSKRC